VLSRALIEGEQIVIPITVRVCAQVLRPSISRIDNAYVRTVSGGILDIEAVCLGLDARNYIFAAPAPPTPARSPQMGDVFMWAVALGLIDARHLNIGHTENTSSLALVSVGHSYYGGPHLDRLSDQVVLKSTIDSHSVAGASMALENLGRLVQEKRGNRGVREVAREIGIGHATLLRVERGQLPDLENYQKICNWLGLDVSTATGINSAQVTQPLARVHFRKAKTVSPKTAQALAKLILAAQQALMVQK
jgi:transcriptional regulator with XRE-family HTH domain